MIMPCGTFDYSVIVERDTDTRHRWLGRARTLRDSSIHPGMLGRRPLFALENGQLLLRSTESRLSILTDAHFRYWGPPVAFASFEVGDAPAAVIQDGDQLAFHRLGTGDTALTIMRNESLVLGIGSLVGLPLGRDIEVADDIRIKEMGLYDLAADFARISGLESHVFWLDLGQGNLEAQLDAMNRMPRSENLIVAIKGARNEKGESVEPDLYDKLLSYDLAESTYFYEVNAQFADKQAWITYVKELPRGRPKDLHLSFAIGPERIKLCEGEEAFIGEYYARVERVYRMGVPGELSSLAIARMSPALTKDIVIESARLMVNAK
jgi:hypothetical protein